MLQVKANILAEVRRKLALEMEENGSPLSQEVFEKTASSWEQAFFAYLELVILRNAPLSVVRNSFYRKFSKYEDVCSFQACFTK